MESFLVMKNNLRRRFTKISTYLVVLLVPVLILAITAITTSIQTPVIRIGITGEDSFYETIQQKLPVSDQLVIMHADRKTLQTDLITGKYSYVIEETMSEKEQNEICVQITGNIQRTDIEPETAEEIAVVSTVKSNAQTNAQSNAQTNHSRTAQMLSLLLTVFIVVSTIYTSSLIYDRTHGLQERFCYAGMSKRTYTVGYFGSTACVTGIQMIVTLLLCHLFDTGFELSVGKEVLIFFFLMIVTNGLGVLISSIVKSEMAANITASSIAVLLSVLGGTFVSIEAMPKLLRTLSWISPMRWMMEIIG